MKRQSTSILFTVVARTSAVAAGVAAAVAVSVTATPATAGATQVASRTVVADPGSRGAVPASVTTPVARAQNSLAQAIVQVRAHHPVRAVTWLDRLRRQVTAANVAAISQIGKPPIDPESDDAPGPPAVLSVLRLDHKVTTSVVDLFDGRKSASVVQAQRLALHAALVRRDAVLDAVIALPAEGDGADYTDSLSDTINWYAGEVTQLTTALSTFELSSAGRLGLSNSLTRVTATKAKFDQAFGGGERNPR